MEFVSGTDETWNLERIIDDFVFMTFLVGNDFLPHMPSLDIGDGAFDLLFDIYKRQRVQWPVGAYLTSSGDISDPARLETFVAAIGAVETEILTKREKDDAVYLKKRRKWDKRDGKADGPSDAELQATETAKQNDYLTMIESIMTKVDSSSVLNPFVDGWSAVTQSGQKDFKGRYYFEKMKMTPLDKEDHWALRKSYMEGLMWCLAYYYKGCISWGWFYPYHYGPMLSDLIDIPKMFDEIVFELGEPLKPFQQLMGCLPPASAALVPKLYRGLMMMPDSPIIHFYPQKFDVDMNGKKNPWEGVNLLPFIDIKLLKDTITAHCPDNKLTVDQRRRNARGKVFCYRYDISFTDTVESPNKNIGLPDIIGSSSAVNVVEELESTGLAFMPEIISGTQIPYPGFPSLSVLPIAKVELLPIGLNCFGSASKYPNTLLTLNQMPPLPGVELLAPNILDKSLFINWPMMHEGKVVAICDGTKEVRIVNGKLQTNQLTPSAAARWASESEAMAQMYHTGNGVPGSGGVQIDEIKIRLKLLPLQGMKTNPANGSSKKLFGKEEADVPLQLALWQAPAPDPRFVERGPMTLSERFPESSSVVLTKGKYRGCKGRVVGVADRKSVGVKVEVIPAELPFGLAIARSVRESHISSSDAAKILKMNPGLFGKVTGRLQFEQGRYDLGLNLKSSDGMCVVGYTRKKWEPQSDLGKKGASLNNAWMAGDSLLVVGSSRNQIEEDREDRIQWEYTPKAIRLVEDYRREFPQLFANIAKKPNEKKYDANKIFGSKGEAWLPVIREWLDKHETAKMPRTPVSTQSMSHEAVAAVQKAADVRSLALKKKGYPKESLIKIPGSALYREGSTGATDVLSPEDLNENVAPDLGDRVVNLCADGIPFGARGTIVGIHKASTTGSVEVVMDEEFMGGSSLQGACSNFRGKLCVWAHLLKILPENGDSMIDKLVPKGSGRAAVERIIANIELGVQQDANRKAHVTSSWDSQVDTAAEQMKRSKINSDSIVVESILPVNTRTPPRSLSRSGSDSRSASAPRPGIAKPTLQTYKEARKPDEKGIGFKDNRPCSTNGFQRWKTVIAGHISTVGKETSELKAMLGLPSRSSTDGPFAPSISNGAALKAMLGVPNSDPFQPVPKPHLSGDGTAVLKEALGMRKNPDQGSAITLGHPPNSAADKLMQIMASKHQQPLYVPSQNIDGPSHSAFNFTYVDEGKEVPVPPPFAPGYSAPNSIGMVPPGPVPMLPYGSPHHPGFMFPQHDFPQRFAPTQQPKKEISDRDFPPLGGTSNKDPPTLGVDSQKTEGLPAEAKEAASKGRNSDNFLIPSAVTPKSCQ